MPRMIFICPKCNSTYGAESGTHNICPDCKIPLIETSITTDYWRTLSNSQKEEAKHDIQGLICQHNEEPVRKQKEQQYHLRTKFCCHCGKEIMDEAVICPGCGCPVQTVNSTPKEETDQSVSVGLVILALLFPLFGCIYCLVSLKRRTICAVACGIAAVISWYLGIASFVWAFIAGFIVGILEYQWT